MPAPEEDPMATAVFEALGAASTCWESLEGTGLFDSDRAKQIGDELLAKIAELTRIDTVWIVNSRGVHSAELCGVYVSERAAAVAALEFVNKADGYHTFEVTELRLDSAVETPELDRHLGVGAPKVTYSPLEEHPRIAHHPLAQIRPVYKGGA